MRRISATFLAPTSLALTAVECGSGPLGRRDTCRGIRVATMADGYANDNFQAEPGYNLRILVEPQPFYRLRYATEMKSFHGALKGSGAPYPMVKLEQTHLMEETETFIRVSVFSASGEPHVHQIALKGPGATAWRLGKHADISVSSQNNFQAQFKNLVIIRRSQSEWIKDEVTRQKKECMNTYPPIAEEKLTDWARQTWKRLEQEQFKLGFYAFNRGCPDVLLCGPLFSRVISNQAQVRVRFFEGDPNQPSWENYAEEVDRHQQAALVVSVPPYREDIEAEVQIQLETTNSDGSVIRSEAENFSYRPLRPSEKRWLPIPANSSSPANQKRSRTTSGSLSEDNIPFQRWGQHLSMGHSSDSVNWQNQAPNLQRPPVEERSSSQNAHYLDDMNLSDFPGFYNVGANSKAVFFFVPFFRELSYRIGFLLWIAYLILWCWISPSELAKDKSCSSAAAKHAIPSLFEVAKTGDAGELQKILKRMTETEKLKLINGRNEQGQTPLNIAVRRNNFQCVKLLCSAGANVNLADKEGNTPYHIAAKRDHTDCLETLLKVEDRELDKKNFEGDAALHLAVRCNSVESAEMLIRAGANVNKKNDTAGSTPLHLAVLFDNRQLVNHLLIQKNIKIHEVNYESKTAAALVKADQKDISYLFKELQSRTVTRRRSKEMKMNQTWMINKNLHEFLKHD